MAESATENKFFGRMTPRASIEGFKPGAGRMSVPNLTASRPSVANKLLGNRAISKFLSRSLSKGSGLQLHAKKSHWKRLKQEDNPKKIKMVNGSSLVFLSMDSLFYPF